MLKSPRVNCIETESPPTSVVASAFFIGVIAAAPPAAATGSSPACISCGAKWLRVSCEIPVKVTGVAIRWNDWPATCISVELSETPASTPLDA